MKKVSFFLSISVVVLVFLSQQLCMGMDEKTKDIARFKALVTNNAAKLRHCFSLNKFGYSSRLARAEKRIFNCLQDIDCMLFLRDECDIEPHEFVCKVANKSALCVDLVDAMDRKEELVLRFYKILNRNNLVASHYFYSPFASCNITPLHYAIIKANEDDNAQDYVQVLLHSGANPNQPDELGRTSLHYATKVNLLGLLLEAGARLTNKAILGYTPLMSHIRQGNKAAAIFLIEEDVNLDEQDVENNTALHHAVNELGDIDIIILLLQRRAHIYISNNKEETPFASEKGQQLAKQLYNKSPMLCWRANFNSSC